MDNLKAVQRSFTRILYGDNWDSILGIFEDRLDGGDLMDTYRAYYNMFGVDLSSLLNLDSNSLREYHYELHKRIFRSTNCLVFLMSF